MQGRVVTVPRDTVMSASHTDERISSRIDHNSAINICNCRLTKVKDIL